MPKSLSKIWHCHLSELSDFSWTADFISSVSDALLVSFWCIFLSLWSLLSCVQRLFSNAKSLLSRVQMLFYACSKAVFRASEACFQAPNAPILGTMTMLYSRLPVAIFSLASSSIPASLVQYPQKSDNSDKWHCQILRTDSQGCKISPEANPESSWGRVLLSRNRSCTHPPEMCLKMNSLRCERPGVVFLARISRAGRRDG